ncbi:MAG TPA: 4Fe-4S binding protein [Acidobacteria bacterium]|nr:4Fe-4S binding protein [Acidobacteriota bacterium]
MSAPRGKIHPLLGWLEGRVRTPGARSYRIRVLVQVGFALLCLVLGVAFARFVGAAQRGTLPLPERPPGVEGFLPISGLMGLLDAFYQGTLNRVHPAATVLFVIFVLIAIVARKAFCSWICPVGLISEALARLGRLLFGRLLRAPRWLDIPLRSLKYLLLGFFLWAIFVMGPDGLRAFITSDYNQVADVKMYLFFAEISRTGAIVLVVLALLSVVVQGAWCRYLCPYGALLGIFSWLSPVKVRRRAETCTDCKACDNVCMAHLPVSRLPAVSSAECTGCLDCLAVCPAAGTLTVGPPHQRWRPLTFAAVVVGLFLAGYVLANAAGWWANDIPDQRYIEHMRRLDDPLYSHPGR